MSLKKNQRNKRYNFEWHFNPGPAEPQYALSLQTVNIQIIWLLKKSNQLASEEAIRSGSTLFVLKYVSL